MKKIGLTLFLLASLGLLVSSAMAMGGAPDTNTTNNSSPTSDKTATVGQAGDKYVIDDFESGSLRAPREWWTFDIQTAKAVSNDTYTGGEREVAGQAGKYSLLLKGNAKNWYSGGCDTYLAKENLDFAKYNALSVDIYGNGPGSGTIKIELLDDDNNNWQVEQDPAKSYAPIYDDKYVTDIRVDWQGWKRVVIAFDDFVDDNPGVGDDVFNFKQASGSGGLLQLQVICLGSKGDALVNLNLDNIVLIVED